MRVAVGASLAKTGIPIRTVRASAAPTKILWGVKRAEPLVFPAVRDDVHVQAQAFQRFRRGGAHREPSARAL